MGGEAQIMDGWGGTDNGTIFVIFLWGKEVSVAQSLVIHLFFTHFYLLVILLFPTPLNQSVHESNAHRNI